LLNFVFLLLVSSLACSVVNYMPGFNLAAGIIWGTVLVVGGYWGTLMGLISVFTLNSLLLFGLSGSSNFFFWASYGIPSLSMGLLLTRQKGYYELQKWGMITASLVVCLYMGVLYSPFGSQIMSDVQIQITEQIQRSSSLQDPEIIQIYEQQGFTTEEFTQNIQQVSRWLVKHLPSMFLLQTLLIVQVVLSISTVFFQKKGVSILQHRPFREEIMPWQLAWVVILGLVLWLLGRNELSSVYYVGSNLLLVTAVIAAIYGMAGIAYWWYGLPFSIRRVVLPLLMVSIIVLFLPALFFVALLGLFDSLFDYRNLHRKKEGIL